MQKRKTEKLKKLEIEDIEREVQGGIRQKDTEKKRN